MALRDSFPLEYGTAYFAVQPSGREMGITPHTFVPDAASEVSANIDVKQSKFSMVCLFSTSFFRNSNHFHIVTHESKSENTLLESGLTCDTLHPLSFQESYISSARLA